MRIVFILTAAAFVSAIYYFGYLQTDVVLRQATTIPERTSAALGGHADGAAPIPPPFIVKGTMISAGSRHAIIAVLDPNQAERYTRQASEGEILEMYLISRIENNRIYFNKDGVEFILPVGSASSPEPHVIPSEAVLARDNNNEQRARILPAPPGADLERVQKDINDIVNRMEMSRESRQSGWRKQPEPESNK